VNIRKKSNKPADKIQRKPSASLAWQRAREHDGHKFSDDELDKFVPDAKKDSALLVALSEYIHGKKFARKEMKWASLMAVAGTKGGTEDPITEAQWKEKNCQQLQPIFDALCLAAAERRPEPFIELAACIEEMKQRGAGWADQYAAKIQVWCETHPGEPLDIDDVSDGGHKGDAKTFRLRAKKMGIPTKKPGRPAYSGKIVDPSP